MSGGSGNVVAGFRYYFGLHMGFSRGEIDELVQIMVGDRTAWYGSVKTSQQIQITAPDLFGGDSNEGGIEGPMDIMMGEPTQVAPAGLLAMAGQDLPGYRGVFTAFFDGLIAAMNPYPKVWKARFRRAVKGWDGECWHPELAVISLTRESTQGEVLDPVTDTNIVQDTVITFFSGSEYVIVVPNSTPLLSVDFIQTGSYSDGGDSGGSGVTLLVEGVDYTVDLPNSKVVFSPSFSNGGLQWTIAFSYEADYNSGDIGTSISLIQAMNPAHIIYECFTNRMWGRGLDRSELDDASFLTAAQQLVIEQFGMCIKWSRTDQIDSFVQTVLDHIGGVVYVDRNTGLLKLKLIRGGYDPDTIPLFDSTNGLMAITQAAVASTAGLINEVQVTYHDPVTDQDRTVKVQNLALKQGQGGNSNVSKKSYPGIPISSLAGRIAQREMKAQGLGVRKFALTFDRRGSSLVPGGLVRVRDLPRGIQDTVVRIGRFEDGTGVDGQIKITAIQDVFAFPSSTFTGTEPVAWVPPTRKACIGRAKVFEVPYITLYKRMSTADFATVTPESAYIGTLMEEGQPLNAAYKVAVKNGAADHTTEDPPNTSYYCAP